MALKQALREEFLRSNPEIAGLCPQNPVAVMNDLVQSSKWVMTQANNGTAVTVELTGPGLQRRLVQSGSAQSLRLSKQAAMEAMLQEPEVQEALRKHKRLCTYAAGYRPSPEILDPFPAQQTAPPAANMQVKDPKMALDMLLARAARYATSPDQFKVIYQIASDGPSHLPTFTVTATLTLQSNFVITAQAKSSQKKEAIKLAAVEILQDQNVQKLKNHLEGPAVGSAPRKRKAKKQKQQSASPSPAMSEQVPAEPAEYIPVTNTATSEGAQQAVPNVPIPDHVNGQNVPAAQQAAPQQPPVGGVNAPVGGVYGVQPPAVEQEASSTDAAANGSVGSPHVYVQQAHPTLVSMLYQACQIKHWQIKYTHDPPQGPCHNPVVTVHGTLQGRGLPEGGVLVIASHRSIKQAKPIAAGLLLQHPEVKSRLEGHPKFRHLYPQQ